MEKEPNQQEKIKTPGDIIDEVMSNGNFIEYGEKLLERDSSKPTGYEGGMLMKEIYNFLHEKEAILSRLAQNPENATRVKELLGKLDQSNAMKDARRPINP